MWVYVRNPSWSWEDYVADSLAGLFIVVAIVVAAIVITVAAAILWEIDRIYQAHANQMRGRTANILWINLAVLLAVWIGAAFLGSNPNNASAAASVAGLWWCVFLIVAEGCDWYEQQQSHQAVRTSAEPQLA